MAQTQVFRGIARKIVTHSDRTEYYYHETPVVTMYLDGRVMLKNGGWQTATTRNAIKQVANQNRKNFGVRQVKGEWFTVVNNVSAPFKEGMVIRP